MKIRSSRAQFWWSGCSWYTWFCIGRIPSIQWMACCCLSGGCKDPFFLLTAVADSLYGVIVPIHLDSSQPPGTYWESAADTFIPKVFQHKTPEGAHILSSVSLFLDLIRKSWIPILHTPTLPCVRTVRYSSEHAYFSDESTPSLHQHQGWLHALISKLYRWLNILSSSNYSLVQGVFIHHVVYTWAGGSSITSLSLRTITNTVTFVITILKECIYSSIRPLILNQN